MKQVTNCLIQHRSQVWFEFYGNPLSNQPNYSSAYWFVSLKVGEKKLYSLTHYTCCSRILWWKRNQRITRKTLFPKTIIKRCSLLRPTLELRYRKLFHQNSEHQLSLKKMTFILNDYLEGLTRDTVYTAHTTPIKETKNKSHIYYCYHGVYCFHHCFQQFSWHSFYAQNFRSDTI